MDIDISPETALNLTLQGSVGSFCTGTKDGAMSGIEVKYFLTHVGLDFENGPNGQALNVLAPVRELFETKTLEFDEIMQRDIDDARVSADLIPYLLDPKSRDLVKIFPPIIVVVLPTEPGGNRPTNHYPAVTEESVQIKGQNTLLTRSGEVGCEVFQFQQPVANGKVIEHDLNRLKLNTERCKLVIVDGQHRAMALLAIYRNLKQEWAHANRAPFKDYYEEWTPNYLKQFELKNINLPVMFCTFPSLDENYKGDYDLKKAARSVFLTLNKNARPVSESRNRLLDDNDLVALFLRNVLSKVKGKDTLASYSLRIHNVELDQFHDRKKIENPISITGVNHIYYLVEHLLFNDGDKSVNGAKPRSGRYPSRTDLSTFGTYERLGNARDALGEDVANTTSRHVFSTETGRILADRFFEHLGTHIVGFFERFTPVERHNKASLWLEQDLKSQANQKILPIIFEGQGLSRVFESHRENLRKKQQEQGFGSEATKVQQIIANLDATAAQIQSSIASFRAERARLFLDDVSDKAKLKIGTSYAAKVQSFVDDLFDNVFSTVAFQTAVVASFLTDVEYANEEKEINGEAAMDKEAQFTEFLSNLNAFFVPRSAAQFKHLVSVFAGDLTGDPQEWIFTKTRHTFRDIVYRGEMQPDQWPKYRYLVLELWKPSDPALSARVTSQRNLCRGQIFNSLYLHLKDEFLVAQGVREDDLTQAQRGKLFKEAFDAHTTMLKHLGAALPSFEEMRGLATPTVGDASVDSSAAQDSWASDQNASAS
jgi:hypothetical protein